MAAGPGRSRRQQVLLVSPDEQWRRLNQEQVQLFGYGCLAWDGDGSQPVSEPAETKPIAIIDAGIEDPGRVLPLVTESCRTPILVVHDAEATAPAWSRELADVEACSSANLLAALGRLTRMSDADSGEQ